MNEESSRRTPSHRTFFDLFEDNFLPSKKEFFLYTINEHQNLTNKIFSARKKFTTTNLSGGNLWSTGKLSKSDTNLTAQK
jgi:hypothetical protein